MRLLPADHDKENAVRQRTAIWAAVVSAAAMIAGAGCTGEAQPGTAAREPAPAAAAASDTEPTLRIIEANGIKIRIAEMGKGPLVLFLHGFPESWYSWRHQLPALAKAGYHAVAPDLRGYGKSDKPAAVEDYDIRHLAGDAVGVLDALGEKTAVLVGHDWGSLVAWNTIMLHPDRFTGLVPMSVPYSGRPSVSPVETWKKTFGENFFYVLYFQEPGAAEAEFDKEPREFLSRLYLSPDSPRDPPEITDPKRSAGGWIRRWGKAKGLPPWLTQKELDYYVAEFTESGFRGGINFYRNFHRNWEITPELTDRTIPQPVHFIAGAQDGVIGGANAEQLQKSMSGVATDLRGVTLVPGAGHWVQQEKPAETNAAILGFLAGLSKSKT
jgi:pimeloyl-ACP methyl ester carboxylesterase